jgi:hypothetical protein
MSSTLCVLRLSRRALHVLLIAVTDGARVYD